MGEGRNSVKLAIEFWVPKGLCEETEYLLLRRLANLADSSSSRRFATLMCCSAQFYDHVVVVMEPRSYDHRPLFVMRVADWVENIVNFVGMHARAGSWVTPVVVNLLAPSGEETSRLIALARRYENPLAGVNGVHVLRHLHHKEFQDSMRRRCYSKRSASERLQTSGYDPLDAG